ncbi:MAG: BlaI/MecI/CopY family transcriptional regulator [Pseudomonadota bacterium]
MIASRDARVRQKPLTAVELELMNIVWDIGPCTVAQMLEALPAGRDLAYTSVSTIVRILEQKGYVRSEKAGRGHRYSALVSKDAYQASSLKHLVRNVFDDTPSLLVRRLLDSDALDAEDLKQIRELLRRRGGA